MHLAHRRVRQPTADMSLTRPRAGVISQPDWAAHTGPHMLVAPVFTARAVLDMGPTVAVVAAAAQLGVEPVSYTHLTLPTTPYV